MDVELAPIADDDIEVVSRFMHAHHNRSILPEKWADALRSPWAASPPHHGFVLRTDGEIVGAYLAYFSDRDVDGTPEKFCNLGAWCVLEPYRAQGLRLLMALLGMRDYHLTDFSPSGNVVPLNRKLKFTELDTTAALLPNLPWGSGRVRSRITEDPDELAATLTGADLRLYEDHRTAAAARHLLVRSGDEYCYVVFRRDTRKRIRAFASVLYVSDPDLFRRSLRRIGAHLLLRYGIAATIIEDRVAGGRGRGTIPLSQTRPKMFKSSTLAADSIDYLYSELACLEW